MKKQQPNIYEAVYWWILGTLRPIRSNALVPMYCKFQSVGGTSFTSDLIIVHKKKHASFSWHHPAFIISEFISSFKLKQEEKILISMQIIHIAYLFFISFAFIYYSERNTSFCDHYTFWSIQQDWFSRMRYVLMNE